MTAESARVRDSHCSEAATGLLFLSLWVFAYGLCIDLAKSYLLIQLVFAELTHANSLEYLCANYWVFFFRELYLSSLYIETAGLTLFGCASYGLSTSKAWYGLFKSWMQSEASCRKLGGTWELFRMYFRMFNEWSWMCFQLSWSTSQQQWWNESIISFIFVWTCEPKWFLDSYFLNLRGQLFEFLESADR